MAWFKKKPDPISDRARALNEEIAALEAQIQQLAEEKERAPKLRTTAIPHGETIQRAVETETKPEVRGQKPEIPAPHEPIFEEVDQDRLKARGEVVTPDHYNELGVRKYDLPALLRRIRNHFRGPSTNNPKLVHYLAAGGSAGAATIALRETRGAESVHIFCGAAIFCAVGNFAGVSDASIAIHWRRCQIGIRTCEF